MTRRETGGRDGVRVMLEIKIRLTLERAGVSAAFLPFIPGWAALGIELLFYPNVLSTAAYKPNI